MTANNKTKPVEAMQPVFDMWASQHGLQDAIPRFKNVLAEYQVLRLVEQFTSYPLDSGYQGDSNTQQETEQ